MLLDILLRSLIRAHRQGPVPIGTNQTARAADDIVADCGQVLEDPQRRALRIRCPGRLSISKTSSASNECGCSDNGGAFWACDGV